MNDDARPINTSFTSLGSLGSIRNINLKFLLPVVLVLGDAAFITLGLLAIVELLGDPSLPNALNEAWEHIFLLYLCLLFWLGHQGHYTSRNGASTEIMQLVVGTTLAAIALSLDLVSWALAVFIVVAGRLAIKQCLFKIGYSKLPTIVIGSASQCATFRRLMDHDWYRGFWIKHEIQYDSVNGDVAAAALSRLACRGGTCQVLLLACLSASEIVPLQAVSRSYGMTFGVAHMPNALLGHLVIDRFFGNDLIVVREVSYRSFRQQAYVKRSFDVIVSLLLLIILMPVFMSIGCLIRLNGGPMFYASPRLGAGGRLFQALKFRTMVVNSDQLFRNILIQNPALRREWEATFKLRNDPRITWIGGFLRRFSLDELPQLINVVRGEMSLVGPRPILPAEREAYGVDFELYCRCVPGITGAWQVSGRNDLAYSRRIELNAWYANNASIWVDVVILVRTISVVLRRVGAI